MFIEFWGKFKDENGKEFLAPLTIEEAFTLAEREILKRAETENQG